MTCDEAVKAISLSLYGELAFDIEDELEGHLDECGGCRAELAREKILHRSLDLAEPVLTPEFLRQCRIQLHDRIESGPPTRLPLWKRLQDLLNFRVHLPSAAQPVGALALIAMGFFGARLVPFGALSPAISAGLTDPVSSRVRNVEPEGAGKVQIIVEETRQKTLSGTLGDDRIRGLLLSAAQDPADPGLRVESMELLKSRPEASDVRNALLTAVQHDPNPGVRLKALEGLKGSAGDPEVRQALARVLLADKNPGVRTQVIDLLIQQKEQARMVGVLQELMRKEENGYVRMRCQKALRDMKASVGTF